MMGSHTTVNGIITELGSFFDQKVVLEAACGSGDFAGAVRATAQKVLAIDVSIDHVDKDNSEDKGVFYLGMNAAAMGFVAGCFDTIVFFNALAQIRKDLNGIFPECMRVSKMAGAVLFITTWKWDYPLHAHVLGAPGVRIQDDQETRRFRLTVVRQPLIIPDTN